MSESAFRSSSSKNRVLQPRAGESAVVEADDERVRPPAVPARKNVGDMKAAAARPEAADPRLVRQRGEPGTRVDARALSSSDPSASRISLIRAIRICHA